MKTDRLNAFTDGVIACGILYLGGIAAAFVSPWISVTAYVAVAAMWLIPDRRFEKLL